MWVSLLPFSSDVVQLIQERQRKTSHLRSGADERLEVNPGKGTEEPLTVVEDADTLFISLAENLLFYLPNVSQTCPHLWVLVMFDRVEF